jgi:hypothetical protein
MSIVRVFDSAAKILVANALGLADVEYQRSSYDVFSRFIPFVKEVKA